MPSTLAEIPLRVLAGIAVELDLPDLVELKYVNDFEDRTAILDLLNGAGIDTSSSIKFPATLTCSDMVVDYPGSLDALSTDMSLPDEGWGDESTDDRVIRTNWKRSYILRHYAVFPRDQDRRHTYINRATHAIAQAKDLLHQFEDASIQSSSDIEPARDAALIVLQVLGKYYQCYHLLGFICYLLNSLSESLVFVRIGLAFNPDFEPLQGKVPLLKDPNTLSDALISALQHLFSRFDKDRDNKLSIRELSSLVSVTNGSPPHPMAIKQMIASLERTPRATSLTWDGFKAFFLVQSLQDPEETRKDLNKLGFDPDTIEPPAMESLKPGRPVFIDEVVDPRNHTKLSGERVRLTGLLEDYDPKADALLLKDNEGNHVLVHTSHLGVFGHSRGSLYQFIGTLAPYTITSDEVPRHMAAKLQPSGDANVPRLQLIAHIIRNVDGMDIDIYRRAVTSLRENMDLCRVLN
ncbi:hypothetical protein EV182_000083 [Spiromyces aspiralis]|uniref:Uncharacterized protein n=1 Tax=Spiromyces aspiralis TaxID=68401 RepID=A0ACC1HPY7_9FUNG|nr:hypothetical protein EV182_000083 [Spiromyces aspiralis]